jgi:hypothetical protein
MLKKILHISSTSNFGGGPDFIYSICKYSNNKSYYYGPNGSKIKNISQVCKILTTNFRYGYNSNLIKKICNYKIDNIHLHGRGALLYNSINILVIRFFLKKKINIIFTTHGINIKYSFLNYLINIFCWFFVDKITFVSNDEYYAYSKLYNIKNYFFIILNGIYINKIKIHHNTSKKKKIISFSRFDKQKNSIEFCEIASKLPQFTFDIYGEGRLKKKCIEYCQINHIKNVNFKKFTHNPQKAILTGFCYLSTSKWEGLPLSVIQAISLGRAICLTKIPGHIDFFQLKFKNINYYTPGNINEAANRILSLYKNFNTKLNLQKFYSIYDINITVKKYNNLYI